MKITKQHWQHALQLIRQSGVRVFLSPSQDIRVSRSNGWVRTRQRIHIGTKDLAWLVLAALAHEYGHCLSARRGDRLMGITLKVRLGLPLTRTEQREYMQGERDAWTLGFAFLRQNGLPINDQMQYARRILINTHRKVFQ